MGKNRKFKNQYLITIEGTTTNGFQAQLFDRLMRAVVQSIGINSQQCSASIKVIDSEGDFDAETQELRKETK